MKFDETKYNVIFKDEWVIGYPEDIIKMEKDYLKTIIDAWEDEEFVKQSIEDISDLIKGLREKDDKLVKFCECPMGGFTLEDVEGDE